MKSKRKVEYKNEELYLECSKCKSMLHNSEFTRSKTDKTYGLTYECKPCRNIGKKAYYLTKKGVMQTIWDSQKSSSKKRKMDFPDYEKKDFIKWLDSQKEFHILYDQWVESNYENHNKPSVDRLDSFKPYSFDNIRVCSWGENKALGHQEHKKANSPNNVYTPVYQLQGLEIIGEYITMQEASRVTGIPQANIWKVCNGERYIAGGFGWKYKNA